MNGRNIHILSIPLAVALGQASFAASAGRVEGWAVYADHGKVYRCRVGGRPEELHDGRAAHACWSADARHVYFVKSSGEIWSMRNDGSAARRSFSGRNTSKCPIAAYRPDPGCVLYVEGRKFFRIDASTGRRAEVHSDGRGYVGEIAISTDGARMAARCGRDLFRIPVGGASSRYVRGGCSSSISPDGKLLTANARSHRELFVFGWDGKRRKTLHAPAGRKWDNQRFSVNSSEYVVYRIEGERAIGINHVPTDTNTKIPGHSPEYPDFFVGSLPGEKRDSEGKAGETEARRGQGSGASRAEAACAPQLASRQGAASSAESPAASPSSSAAEDSVSEDAAGAGGRDGAPAPPTAWRLIRVTMR
jgi:hypothetical protein